MSGRVPRQGPAKSSAAADDVFAEAQKVGAQMEAEGYGLQDRVNVYACTPPMMAGSTMKGGCGYWICTVDREPGVTPMFTKCGHCGGTATSRMYKVDQREKPTHEWFRPKSAAELPKGYTVDSVAQHLRNGGLLLRPIGNGKWIKPTPAIREFIKREQEMLAGPPA